MMAITCTPVLILPEDFRLFLGSPVCRGCGRPFAPVDVAPIEGDQRFTVAAAVARERGETHCVRCRNAIEVRRRQRAVRR